MNDKKEIIKLWSILFSFTTIFNVLFISLLIKLEIYWFAIVGYCSCMWNVVAFAFWIASFTTKYKKLKIKNYEVEIYAGFINHYIKVNGEIKDEYKSSITFSPIKLSCIIENQKLEVTISTSNHIVAKYNDELLK